MTKKSFIFLCVFIAFFIIIFMAFNVCITHTEQMSQKLQNEIEILRKENIELNKRFIEHQINHNTTDTIVLSVMPQHVNIKFNSKK